MAKLEGYPGVSSFTKSDKLRWRYRSPGRDGKQVNLPGQPGELEFEKAYAAAAGGKTPTETVTITKLLDARTVNAAYRLMVRGSEWEELDTLTRRLNGYRYTEFLNAAVAEGSEVLWKDIPMADIKTIHVRKYLETIRKRSAHAPKQMLVAIRRLTRVAIQEGWIEYDPTFSLETKAPPKGLGHRKWSDDAIAQFRTFHKVGTQARTAFELAYWLGNRCSDVTRLRWDHLIEETVMVDDEERDVTAFAFRQKKNSKRTGGKQMFLPVRQELAEALMPLDRSTSHVLMNTLGTPYADGSLTVLMRIWTKQAGLPAGYRLHGLRKNFGIKLAEDGATALQIQNAMGHSSQKEADPYLQEANAKKLVADAFMEGERLDRARMAKKRRAGFKVA